MKGEKVEGNGKGDGLREKDRGRQSVEKEKEPVE